MGKIELDHTGSGSGITLSSDGTDLLLDGTAIVSGPTFYAETFTATDPLPTANGTSCFAIGAYSQANAFGTIALGYDVRANSLSSTSIGRNSNGQGSRTATGHGAMALGGSYASGTDSFAAAIANNTSTYGATGANSIALGYLAKASSNDSIAIGESTQSTYFNTVAIGDSANASGNRAMAIGRSTQASGDYATALGANSSSGGSIASGAGSVALGGSLASGSSSVAIGIGTSVSNGATNTNAVAIGKNARANGSSALAVGDSTDATSNEATAIGMQAQAAGVSSIALGQSRTGGTHSFAAVIQNNTSSYGATGANSVAIGYLNIANDPNAVAIGKSNISSGSQTSIAIGQENNVTGMRGVAIGSSNTVSGLIGHAYGDNNTVSGQYAVAFNRDNDAASNYSFVSGYYADSHGVKGRFARGTGGLSLNGTKGDAQYGLLVLVKNTTDATQTALSTDTLTAGSDNQLVVQNNGAVSFHGTIVAKQAGSSNVAAWEVKGLMHNVTTATLVNSAITVIDNTPGWGLAMAADTTNDAVQFLVTGAASTNISWVATIHSSEVIRS